MSTIRPEQGVVDHGDETQGAAFMDGEKTGMMFRAGAMALDKLFLHSPLADIDTHLSIGQHVTASRVFIGAIVAVSARNAYQRFRYAMEDDIDVFEREMELEELREIEEGNSQPAAEHISGSMSLHERA